MHHPDLVGLASAHDQAWLDPALDFHVGSDATSCGQGLTTDDTSRCTSAPMEAPSITSGLESGFEPRRAPDSPDRC